MSEEEPASTEATGAESPPFDLRTVAYEELGETPQLKRDTVMELRKLINAEPDLKCPSDDAFLVKFLRARKYRVEEAFCTIRKYFRVRQVHRNIFDDLRPSQIMFNAVFHQNKLVTILDERDHLGRLVAILKLGAWKPHMCPLDELFRAGVLVGEYILLSETTQVAGVVAVVDLEGLNFELFRHYTPSVVRKLIELAQECYPIRIKGVYITNNPPIFELIYSVAKLFLKPKLVDRTHFIGRDYQKLHALIPRERLPEEYDGTRGKVDYHSLEKSLRKIEDFYLQIARYGYRPK
ncbi:alpha-tocopherol transfer protein-like [Ixodes scapularis]|uniref:alpha-tocopherol transfer protein-like n=1 Tax=Ixodes scapularis TaxID=6945 RepID=UPI001A9F8950|nr:alpha-tocopherol transfer protein-like [Ixodes scapularis]